MDVSYFWNKLRNIHRTGRCQAEKDGGEEREREREENVDEEEQRKREMTGGMQKGRPKICMSSCICG